MTNYSVANFWLWRWGLDHWSRVIEIRKAATPSGQLNAEEANDLRGVIAKVKTEIADRLHLVVTQDRCHRFIGQLDWAINNQLGATDPFSEMSFKVMKSELDGIETSLNLELDQRKFAFISFDRQRFFERTALFGPDVKKAFSDPDTVHDIKEAGNCLAADLNTAAVFHLMRIAERGMRALAKHLHVRIEKGRKAKPAVECPRCKEIVAAAIPASSKLIPLDYAMWEEVLAALGRKIRAIKNKPKGRVRTEDYEFYHGLLIQLDAFKDLWRNEVSHCRRTFDKADAHRVYSRVSTFMQQLVTRVQE